MLPSSESMGIPAIRVHQWLDSWDSLDFDASINQAKPEPYFYMFSMSAAKLRSLAGIYRRSTSDNRPRADDLGIQRRHDRLRSLEIKWYVEGGYPWSGLGNAKRANPENDRLKKPGWLPTAVVVNMLKTGDKRDGHKINSANVVSVIDGSNGMAELLFPSEGVIKIPPVEVIDGQHRLFAFDGDEEDDYELPVVAFHGLDISWQAYLFWTINIKPKKINPSLAFDLYPLLREQDWLDSGESVQVYKESRAQELTEMLWAVPESPWYQRINMLGGPRAESGPVTQAAFIRSLMASMVKSWRPTARGPGGLFGGTVSTEDGLAWSRLQQSAFLVAAWRIFQQSVEECQDEWASTLRDEEDEPLFDFDESDADPAFVGRNSLLATDQGVRGFQYIINDFCYLRQDELQLGRWANGSEAVEVTAPDVAGVIRTLNSQPVLPFLHDLCRDLARFDWRATGAHSLSEQQRLEKAALRGSGGYRELRSQLVAHLRRSHDTRIAQTARELTK
jgi:DGQHR domain-containing protein